MGDPFFLLAYFLTLISQVVTPWLLWRRRKQEKAKARQQEKEAREHGLAVQALLPEDLTWLQAHGWKS